MKLPKIGFDGILKELLGEIKGMRKDLNEKIDQVNEHLREIEEQNKRRFKKLHPDVKL